MSRAYRKKRQEINTAYNVVRLNYLKQIDTFVCQTYANNPNSYIFSDAFEARLRDTIDRVNGWVLRLVLFQFPIYLFLLLTSQKVYADAVIIGIRLTENADAKAYLLLISSVLGLATAFLSIVNQHRCAVLSSIIDCKYKSEADGVMRYIAPDSLYLTNWMQLKIPGYYTIRESNVIDALIAVAVLLSICMAVALMVALQLTIWRDVYNTTGLHLNFPTAALVLSLLASFFSFVVNNHARRRRRYMRAAMKEQVAVLDGDSTTPSTS